MISENNIRLQLTISKEDVIEFNQFASDHGMTKSEFFNYIYQCYKRMLSKESDV